MEGLHHDTILEPEQKVPKTKTDNPESQNAETQDSAITATKDFSQSEANISLSNEDKFDLYEKMIRIRRFEERSLRSYQQGHIGGFLHLYIGQEAVAVGSVSMLGKDDHIITAYRDHGTPLRLEWILTSVWLNFMEKKRDVPKEKVVLCIFLLQIKTIGVDMV